MMHGMQRYLSDILGHSWARSIAKAAQRVVTHFDMSNGAKQLLLKMRLDLGIAGPSLQSSNTTRFTSVVSMLESIDRNANALKMLGSHPHFAPRQAVARSRGAAGVVADTLRNEDFFKDVAFLVEVLRPVAKVIMAVQGAHTTLGDVTRYWLYLARALLEVVDSTLVDAPAGE
jgi:hypothetical protein